MKKLKVCTLLLIVILNLMFVSSCWVGTYLPYQPDKAFESGSVKEVSQDPYFKQYIAVKSDIDIFDIDNIFLDVYIGLYHQDYVKDYGLDNKYSDTISIDIVYLPCGFKINDNQNKKVILNEYVLKNISIEDAKTGNYTFYTNESEYVKYNYFETMPLPSNYFSEEEGEFYIFLKNIIKLENGDEIIETVSERVLIYFKYEKVDDRKIKLRFEYENYSDNKNLGNSPFKVPNCIEEYYNF